MRDYNGGIAIRGRVRTRLYMWSYSIRYSRPTHGPWLVHLVGAGSDVVIGEGTEFKRALQAGSLDHQKRQAGSLDHQKRGKQVVLFISN